MKKSGAGANLQEFAEGVAGMRNVQGPRSDRRIGEQRLHDWPVALVLAGDGSTGAPVVRLIAEVELVEPVAGVEAVVVHVLGAKQVVAREEKGHALAQRDQAHGQDLASLAGVYIVSRRRFELHGVEERLVVVY